MRLLPNHLEAHCRGDAVDVQRQILPLFIIRRVSMPSSSWKGYISFGLISIPIRLYPGARAAHIAFHEIHKKCGTRVHQQLYCSYDKEVVSRDDIAMGYEIEKDKYVLVDSDELKKLQPRSSTAMEILQFVKLSEVDPVYFDTSYFAVPEEAGERAYALLLATMSDMDCAAIAKVTMHQREHTIIIRPFQKGLILHTLYYPKEIHEAKGYGRATTKTLKKQEVELADQFAKALVKPFLPDQFQDEYAQRVKQLVESKNKGTAGPRPEKALHMAPVVDLMTALKKSLAGTGKAETQAKPRKLRKIA
jgi:DNA end-binding protein Ku